MGRLTDFNDPRNPVLNFFAGLQGLIPKSTQVASRNLINTLTERDTKFTPGSFIRGTSRPTRALFDVMSIPITAIEESVTKLAEKTPLKDVEVGIPGTDIKTKAPKVLGFAAGIAVPLPGGKISKGKSLVSQLTKKLHPEDAKELMKLIPKIQAKGEKATSQELVDLQNLAERYLPKDLATATTKTIANKFDEVLKEIRAPSVGPGKISPVVPEGLPSVKIPARNPTVLIDELNKGKNVDDNISRLNKIMDAESGSTFKNKLIRAFPYADESARVSSTGRAGKEIVHRARRVNIRMMPEKAKAIKELDGAGLMDLTKEETTNLFLAREGKEAFMSTKVADVSNKLENTFIGRAPKEIGFDPIGKYAPRRPNEEGRKFYKELLERDEDTIIERIMKDQGIEDKAEAARIYYGGDKKAFFEKARVLEELPRKYRDTSMQPWLDYAEEYARRKLVIEEFGVGDGIINSLKLEVDGKDLAMVDKYINRIKGDVYDSQDLKGVADFIKTSMIVSKISPTTTVANEFQAQASSFLTDGVTGIVDSMKPGGVKLSKELGLDQFKGKFGDFLDPKSLATKWMRAMGMTASEMRGINRAAKSSYEGIHRAWRRLVKNPQDVKAKKYIQDLSMYVDESALAKDLKAGHISAEELYTGSGEAARQKMFFPTKGERPPWANSPIGSSAYIFHNYVLHALNLLRKAPVHRQLAYVLVLAPIVGLPAAYLRNVLTGREQPTTPQEMFQQGIRYGPATPLELESSLGTERGQLSTITGGFSPYLSIATRMAQQDVGGTAKAAFKALPIPLAGLIANRLFPSKQQQQKKKTKPVPRGKTRGRGRIKRGR